MDTMNRRIGAAISAMQGGMPGFDANRLTVRWPEKQSGVGEWITHSLAEQRLLEEIEQGFWGWVPELAPLAGLDLAEFEAFASDVNALKTRIEQEGIHGVPPSEERLYTLLSPGDVPYLSVLNATLQAHGLVVVRMTAIQDSWPYFYLICLKSDANAHADLEKSWKPFGLHLYDIAPPLSRRDANRILGEKIARAAETREDRRAEDAAAIQELLGKHFFDDLKKKARGIADALKQELRDNGQEP
ncbi:MAG: hypothetical protein LBF51_09385 [Zoogloeaceae bacterium]|nr:hypothetical protein [Zoogloeaceae bacterium]